MTISFRPLEFANLPMLRDWIARPHVAAWWGVPPSREELEEEYRPLILGEAPHRAYIALLDGAPLGFIQSYVAAECHADGWWLNEQDPGVLGIDQFLADGERLGRGLGAAMVGAFVEMLFADPSVTRVQTDPSPANARAIRCYEKAGFRAAGEVVTPDGPALLMYRERRPPDRA
ncbi:MAG TPA: GNAT family N-acetyltransferase [Gemmatimonadaceae bacterium]|nr:GNAT family N-acetyltransferase [Gemmatimonadaceae bacterium]